MSKQKLNQVHQEPMSPPNNSGATSNRGVGDTNFNSLIDSKLPPAATYSAVNLNPDHLNNTGDPEAGGQNTGAQNQSIDALQGQQSPDNLNSNNVRNEEIVDEQTCMCCCPLAPVSYLLLVYLTLRAIALWIFSIITLIVNKDNSLLGTGFYRWVLEFAITFDWAIDMQPFKERELLSKIAYVFQIGMTLIFQKLTFIGCFCSCILDKDDRFYILQKYHGIAIINWLSVYIAFALYSFDGTNIEYMKPNIWFVTISFVVDVYIYCVMCIS